MPGENTGMMIIASVIGLLAGLFNIIFRTIVHWVDIFLIHGGKELLSIDQGGWHLLLLPLIPMFGMVLLVPLSLLFPGEVNGYSFTKFLRKVNLEGGYIKGRTIALKIVSTALTIGSGNSAGVEGPIAAIGGAAGSQVGKFFRVSGSRMKVYIAAGAAGGIAGMFNAPLPGFSLPRKLFFWEPLKYHPLAHWSLPLPCQQLSPELIMVKHRHFPSPITKWSMPLWRFRSTA